MSRGVNISKLNPIVWRPYLAPYRRLGALIPALCEAAENLVKAAPGEGLARDAATLPRLLEVPVPIAS